MNSTALLICTHHQSFEKTIQSTQQYILYRSFKKMTCTVSVKRQQNLEILACNSLNALENCKNLCHTFTSNHFFLEKQHIVNCFCAV